MTLPATTVPEPAADPVAARPPWSPTGIALLTLLISPFVGAVLHALNYHRLGVPERWRLTLFANLVPAMLVLWSATRGSSGGSIWRWEIALLLAAYFYKTQEGRFRRHRAGGGRRGSLFLPAVLLILAMLVLGALLAIPELFG